MTRDTLSASAHMILKVKRPDFLGDSKWEFRYDGKVFIAKITDQEWLTEYRNGEVSLSPGDALKAHVESEVKYGYEHDVVSTQHTIVKVIEIIKPDPPMVQGIIDGLITH